MPIRATPAHKQATRPPVTLAERIVSDRRIAERKLWYALYTLNKHRHQHGN